MMSTKLASFARDPKSGDLFNAVPQKKSIFALK